MVTKLRMQAMKPNTSITIQSVPIIHRPQGIAKKSISIAIPRNNGGKTINSGMKLKPASFGRLSSAIAAATPMAPTIGYDSHAKAMSRMRVQNGIWMNCNSANQSVCVWSIATGGRPRESSLLA